MTLEGKIGSLSTQTVRVVAPVHAPVIQAGRVKAGQGVLEPGTILTRDDDLALVAWDGATGDPVGVLNQECDTAAQTTAGYVKHGTVATAVLLLADGSAPSEAQIYLLDKAGIIGV